MLRRSLGAGLFVVLSVMMLFSSGATARAGAARPYVHFDRFDTHRALSEGHRDAVVISRNAGGTATVRLGAHPHRGTDRSGKYNGGAFYWGSILSPVHRPGIAFDTLNPSWNASTPPGTWIELDVRVRSGGSWTRWFDLGIWAKGTGTIERHSVDGQKTARWQVATDTLQGRGRVFAGAYQYRLKLFTAKKGISPGVRALFFTTSNSYRAGEPLGVGPDRRIWGKNLAVPPRSQMVYPDGGEVWCSPTSLSMVMAYWAKKTGREALDQPVPRVARGTYDHVYGGTGNWPFNTAYAASYGLVGSVNRFSSLGQAERFIGAGIPLVASVAWHRGELDGAPIPSTEGHLLVIRGFTRSGDVIVNDPAAKSAAGVERVYERDQFRKVWFETGSGGMAYLVYPRGHQLPSHTYARGSW